MTISQEIIHSARQADLVKYLRNQGYEMKHEGSGNYRLQNYRNIIIQTNHWFDHKNQVGGNSIGFLMKIEGFCFQRAVQCLAGLEKSVVAPKHQPPGESYMNFKLPLPATNNQRIISYLTYHRWIPASIVNTLIKQQLLYQDIRSNCVFVCQDRRAAFLRGTNPDIKWRGMAPGSDSSYPWIWMAGGSDIVVVCESPIDCMSLNALNPKNSLYVATNGLRDAALIRAIHTYNPTHVILALDNDEAGQTVAAKWQQQLVKSKIIVSIEKPNDKDWNETLIKNKL